MIKKILISVLSLLLVYVSNGQIIPRGTPNYTPQGNANTTTGIVGTIQAGVGFIDGLYDDTLHANLLSQNIWKIPFYNIATRNPIAKWYRDTTTNAWIKVGTGSSGGNTIYTGNGSLNSARNVNGNNNSILWSNLKGWDVEDYSNSTMTGIIMQTNSGAGLLFENGAQGNALGLESNGTTVLSSSSDSSIFLNSGKDIISNPSGDFNVTSVNGNLNVTTKGINLTTINGDISENASGGIGLSSSTGVINLTTNGSNDIQLASANSISMSLSQPLLINGDDGTDGYVFTSHGLGAPPTWSPVSGGSLGLQDVINNNNLLNRDDSIRARNNSFIFDSVNNFTVNAALFNVNTDSGINMINNANGVNIISSSEIHLQSNGANISERAQGGDLSLTTDNVLQLSSTGTGSFILQSSTSLSLLTPNGVTFGGGSQPFTLPNTDGSAGQVLVTDGTGSSGGVTWQNISTPSLSTLTNGFGILGSPYDGSANQLWLLDTSSTGVSTNYALTDSLINHPIYNGIGYLKLSGTTPSYISSIPNSDLAHSSITLSSPFGLTYSGSGVVALGNTLTVTPDTTSLSSLFALKDSSNALRTFINTKGSGTVTSVATGYGLTGGTITTIGTIVADTTKLIPYTDTAKLGGIASQTFVNTRGFLSNITGLVTAGTNIILGGAGTGVSPYAVNADTTTGTTKLATQGFVSRSIPASFHGWDTTGNKGITAANYIGTNNNASLRFYTNNSPQMILDSIGHLTIGGGGLVQQNPIVGDSSHILVIVNDSTRYQLLDMKTYGTSAGLTGQNNFHGDVYGGRQSAPRAAATNDFMLSWGGRMYDGVTLSSSAAAMQCIVGSTPTPTNHETYFRWQVTPAGSITRNQAFQINGNGSVYISNNQTLTPYRTTTQLVLDGVGYTGDFHQLIQSASTNGAGIIFGESTSNEALCLRYGSTESGAFPGIGTNVAGFFSIQNTNSTKGIRLSGSPILLQNGVLGSNAGVRNDSIGVRITPLYDINSANTAFFSVGRNSPFAIDSLGNIGKYNGSTITNGQLLIGNTSTGIFNKATLTAGAGIAITNGAGSVTIATLGSGSTPTIVAGAGAGSTPTVSIAGNNIDGIITITAGTLPTASAVVATITLGSSQSYATSATMTLTPNNLNAELLSGGSQIYVTGTPTTTVMNVGTVGLSATLTYTFIYHIGGY